MLECTGAFRTPEALRAVLRRAACRKVVVAAPVKDDRALNVVVGVNDDRYDPDAPRHRHRRVVHDELPRAGRQGHPRGHRHPRAARSRRCTTSTNTQIVVDAPHKDLRRARAASMSLIPTTTGSATAIGLIFPELQGKLDGLAVRVPLLNASLTDCVFEVARPTTVEEVNGLLAAAADGPLQGILGYEERPLVSVDFKDDPRSGIVDAPSTMVTDGTQVKVLAWYDNEWGYANRLVELARTVGEPRWLTRRRPAQLRARHRRLLGRHDRRRRDPDPRPLLLLRARLQPVRGRVAVPLLRALRDRHEPRRRVRSRRGSG